MPASEHPNKRRRTDAPVSSKAKVFKHATEISPALRADNQESLVEALTTIRNQLSVKSSEELIAPQDERLYLVKQWMQNSAGAYDLFLVWDSATLRQNSILALVLSILSSILTLLSAHYTDHALGQLIMKSLLVPSRFRQLNSYIGGSYNDLIIATLKLYNVMSNFGGGHDKKAVLEGFGWEIKSLPKLLNMRRKNNGDKETVDPLSRPDIRTLYILFLLSFVETGNSSQIKTAFLEQHREAFLAIFKGMAQDHYLLSRKVLEVCWAGIWSDAKVKRTLKVGLFNETTLANVFKLYERTQSDDDEEDYIPANLVHHFLLAICTRPGAGICFKDRGWYPRETEGDEWSSKKDDETMKKGGKIYNKILANILKTLKVNEDSRQQELAIKILAACPELVAGYWSAAALTLEPRLSSKWIANIAVFGNIISLPIPMSNFYMQNTQLYQPTPPLLSTVIENILPSVGTKNNFSKGLQSPSGLVQHCTALALARCLVKYRTVLDKFRSIAVALEESEDDGQWNKLSADLEREVRRRVPEFQVIIGFSQQKHVGPQGQVNETRVALLAESAQRLLWLYYHCLPAVVAEARFDVGKLLQAFAQNSSKDGQAKDEDDNDDEEGPDAASRLYRVQQLHVLSLLKDNDQFVGTSKIASLPYTPFRMLLTACTTTAVPAIHAAITTLLHHILSQTILFQEDAQEPDLWLKALPDQDVGESDDNVLFQGEIQGLITFLDDCVQRCLKTPYRYVEALHALENHSDTAVSTSDRFDMYPSPLLMTLIEQLDAKINKKSLPPSHLLGVVSFTRKLCFNLASKTLDLRFLHAYTQKLDEMLVADRIPQNPPSLFSMVRREMDILEESLSFSSLASPIIMDSKPEVEAYLTTVEEAEIPDSQRLRALTACRLINQMRTLRQPLAPSGLKRLVDIITKLDSNMLSAVFDNLLPGQTDVWSALELTSTFSTYRRSLDFYHLYTHSGLNEITDEKCQIVLADSLFVRQPTLNQLSRAVYLITHGIYAARQHDDVLKAHFSLLARIFTNSKQVLPKDFSILKDIIFVQSNIVRDVLISPASSDVLQGVQVLLDAALDPISEADRKTVAVISNYWFNALKTDLENQSPALIFSACTWVKYLETEQLFDLLDFLEKNARIVHDASTIEPINVVLQALCAMTSVEWQAEPALVRRLPQLLSLKSILSDSPLLEQIIATAIEATLPMGLDGCPSSSTSSNSSELATFVKRAESRWSQRNQKVELDIDIQPFLLQPTFSYSTAKIIACLLYQTSSRQHLIEWLISERSLLHDARYLVPILHAFVDSSLQEGSTIVSSITKDVWLPFIPKIVQAVADVDLPVNIRIRAQDCLLNILSVDSTKSSKLLDTVAKEMKRASRVLSHELLSTAIRLSARFGSKVEPIAANLIDHGLQWFIDQFAGEEDISGYDDIIQDLTLLIKVSSVSKTHLVETLLSIIIQNHFSNVDALRLAAACLPSAQLKPLIVNRHLQAILQHGQFFKTCSGSSAENAKIRDTIIELLYHLFHLHPHNTCQITHVEPLIRVYRGTLSQTDLRILSIFQLFEAQRKLSVTPIISRWSSTYTNTSETALEALQSLDPILVLRTCLNFPRWRKLEDQSANNIDSTESGLYDPIFLMLLFSQMITEQTPTSAFGWIELFRSNVVSLFIRALSAKDGQIRDLALCQIVGLWRQLEYADLQEKPHVMYILNLLKDLIPAPTIDSPEYPDQLPTYTSLLLMHSLRAVFNPSNLIYPITARFLLQRPTLDTADVPMLFGMLYSSSDDHWKQERGWMIKFLADGMVGSEDWRILKRRHTWDLLASLFQSTDGSNDTPLRLGILEILANLTCNAQATTSLVLKSALLSWIEMQISRSNRRAEGVEWVKILENILIIVDAKKVEAATNGEWRAVICRCLIALLDGDNNSIADENLQCAVPGILRLASLDAPALSELPSLLDVAVKCLERLEGGITVDLLSSSTASWEAPANTISSAPHHSLTLHQRHQATFTAVDKGRGLIPITEQLWRVSMTLEEKCIAWEKLSPRLLLWRSVYGSQFLSKGIDMVALEWARKETVYNLSQTRC